MQCVTDIVVTLSYYNIVYFSLLLYIVYCALQPIPLLYNHSPQLYDYHVTIMCM